MHAPDLLRQVKDLSALIGPLEDEILRRRPDISSWNVLEIIEHLIIVEESITRIILSDKGEVNTEERYLSDELISQVNHNFDQKYSAPEFTLPAGLLTDVKEGLGRLLEVRMKLGEKLNKNEINWTLSCPPHFALGRMTKKDWLEFMVTHFDRHIFQIRALIK